MSTGIHLRRDWPRELTETARWWEQARSEDASNRTRARLICKRVGRHGQLLLLRSKACSDSPSQGEGELGDDEDDEDR